MIDEEIINKIIDFRDKRNWQQFHNPKDLAISLSIEASELLENFQWKNNEEALENNFDNIKDEIADVMIYSILLSKKLDLDVEKIINDKLEKNKKKYPVDKAYGSNEKYDQF